MILCLLCLSRESGRQAVEPVHRWAHAEGMHMKRVAQFFKVSFENFAEAVKGDFPDFSDMEIREMYDKIRLPERATRCSAGYDFLRLLLLRLRRGRRSGYLRESVRE